MQGAQRIIFVSGKGGVGKSLISAAIAGQAARSGQRVLLAEIGDKSYFKDFWHLDHVGNEPRTVKYGFDLALWSGESCLREYILFYLRMEKIYHLFFENKVMRSLINVAPGLNEVAILGKITSGIRKVGPPLNYDLIVVDAYATGHFLSLLKAPHGMMEAIKFGPMGHHSREIDRVLRDPKYTEFVAVTLLEEMPMTETLEFRETLKRDLGIETDFVANKVLETPISTDELRSMDGAQGLQEFITYLIAVKDRQTKYLQSLRATGVELRTVPLIFSAEPEDLVRQAEEALSKP